MRIVFLAGKGDDESKKRYLYLKEKLEETSFLRKNKFDYFDLILSDKNLKKIKDAEGLVLFVNVEINRRIMRDLPHLKFIATMSTGYDHIDIESAKEFGISVCNVPAYGANTVAEHTFGLILNLTRKLWKAIDRVKENNFSLDGLRGIDLRGKTIGIIGVGNIGKRVVEIANGFGMEILGYDRNEDKELKRKFGVVYVSLDYLLKNSDIVSVHLPLTRETKHLINKENVKKIKKGAILINTARGEIVETGALRFALDKGIISAAGLDVLEGEEEIHEESEFLKRKEKISDWKTLIENHLLIDYENVIITPHMAFYSIEAEKRILDTTLENIAMFLMKKVKNKVN